MSRNRWLSTLPNLTVENADGDLAHPTTAHTVADDVCQALWDSLPMANQTAADFSQPKDVVKCFSESHSALVTAHGELLQLFRTMCEITLESRRHPELDQQKQKEREASYIDECLDEDFPPPMLGQKFSTQSVVGTPDEVFERLQTLLREATQTLIEDLFSYIERLVKEEIVGLIRWYSEDTCSFYAFRTRIVHELASIEEQTTHDRAVDDDYSGPKPFPAALRIVERNRHVTTKYGRHIYEKIKHEQKLIDASSREIDDPSIVVPWEICVDFLSHVPRWLRPTLRIVVGDCFSERFIRRQFRLDEVAEEKIEESVKYSFCPAIVLGHFVLMAWGQLGHDQELRRRERQRLRESDRRSSVRYDILATVLLYAGVFFCVFGILFNQTYSYVGLACAALALMPGTISLSLKARCREKRLDWKIVAFGNLSYALLFAAFISMIVAAVTHSKSGLMYGGLCFVLGILCSHATKELLSIGGRRMFAKPMNPGEAK